MSRDKYGGHRVISPLGLLPQAADKISNDLCIYSNEILIDVIALQPTATVFGRIKKECGGNPDSIAKEIMRIVSDYRKFQDPVTKSGGMLIGQIKEIGDDFVGTIDAQVGDKIATLVSLSLPPIEEITEINLVVPPICHTSML